MSDNLNVTTKNEIPSKENKMGVMPVRKLIFTMSMPAIISMTIHALYNIVDSIYIGHGCGALALGALTVAKMATKLGKKNDMGK